MTGKIDQKAPTMVLFSLLQNETLNFGSIDNKGGSGRPMANGSANGFGTNTTGKMYRILKPIL